jgi:hypothetical protein
MFHEDSGESFCEKIVGIVESAQDRRKQLADDDQQRLSTTLEERVRGLIRAGLGLAN